VGGGDPAYLHFIPAGMDGSKPVKIKPHWKSPKPFQVRLEFLRCQLVERCFVLLLVFWNATAKMVAGRVLVFCVVGQGVEFVVAHDGQGLPFLDHGPDDFKHLPNLRPPVDEIAEENHLAV
jgi:hypothetical protein